MERRIYKKENDLPPYLLCSICRKPVYLSRRHTENGNRWFTHSEASTDCPWYEGRKLSPDQIMALRYRGQKESLLHQKLKNFIADWLEQDQCVSGKVNRDKVTIGDVLKGQWKRPDVSCVRNNKKTVFEIQLSYTFLSEVIKRDTFYKAENTFIFWIFREFSLNRSTHVDEAFFNHRNIFVLDNEAQAMTETDRQLKVKCYFQRPALHEFQESSWWDWSYVSLDDIEYPNETFRPFYHDYNKELDALIADGFIGSAFAYYKSNYLPTYKDQLKSWISFLEEKGFFGVDDDRFWGWHGILSVLLSIKSGSSIGYGDGKPFTVYQILESVLREATKSEDRFKFLYLCAYKVYSPVLSDKHEKHNNWINNVAEKIKDSLRNGEDRYMRDSRYDDIIVFLFPELKSKLENRKWVKITE